MEIYKYISSVLFESENSEYSAIGNLYIFITEIFAFIEHNFAQRVKF